jgi:hypothetical protein
MSEIQVGGCPRCGQNIERCTCKRKDMERFACMQRSQEMKRRVSGQPFKDKAKEEAYIMMTKICETLGLGDHQSCDWKDLSNRKQVCEIIQQFWHAAYEAGEAHGRVHNNPEYKAGVEYAIEQLREEMCECTVFGKCKYCEKFDQAVP